VSGAGPTVLALSLRVERQHRPPARGAVRERLPLDVASEGARVVPLSGA
jgi:homoserine kinase